MYSKFNRSNVKVVLSSATSSPTYTNTKHQQNNSIKLLFPTTMKYEQLMDIESAESATTATHNQVQLFG